MPQHTRHNRVDVIRFVALAAGAGAAVPFAAAALGKVVALFFDAPATGPLGVILLLLCVLLWPPVAGVLEMFRIGRPVGELAEFLAPGAAMNAVTFAVAGALLWYALYRQRWAWLPLGGLLTLYWWPLIRPLFR